MCMGGGGDKAAKQARAAEEARQARIQQGMGGINNAFSQFNDDFYNTRSSAYTAYQTPQLEKQFEDAKRELTLALARSGNSQSSLANTKFAELKDLFDTSSQDIVSRSKDFANTERSSVENARGELINQLNMSGDATLAAQAAQQKAALLGQGQSFDTLGQIFANITDGLATQADLERRGSARFGTNLFNTGGSGGSSRVVK